LENIKIEASESTPAINFSFADNLFVMSGMSYMEDTGSFFGELMEKLRSYFDALENAEVKFIFDLAYFNSSSSRVIFNLFELLDETAEKGNKIVVEWHFDDEDIGEEGEELAEDLEHVTFELVEKES
jgi:hypothetical protein